jgi:hypothetical protein
MQDINLSLCKRHNEMKQHLSHIESMMGLLDSEVR